MAGCGAAHCRFVNRSTTQYLAILAVPPGRVMRPLKLALCAPAISGAIVANTASAEAQTVQSGFQLNRFDPSERGSEWFFMDSLDLRGHLRPAFGLVGDWGYKPLVLYNPDGSERSAIVEHQLFVHAGGSVVLWDRVRAAVNVPLAIYQAGDAPVTRDNAKRFTSPETGLGDMRLSADVRLLGEYGDVFTSGLGVALFLPTGSRDNYTGDGHVRFTPRAFVAGDIPIGDDIGFAYGA